VTLQRYGSETKTNADTLAIAWGFTEELEAFLAEVERDTWF